MKSSKPVRPRKSRGKGLKEQREYLVVGKGKNARLYDSKGKELLINMAALEMLNRKGIPYARVINSLKSAKYPLSKTDIKPKITYFSNRVMIHSFEGKKALPYYFFKKGQKLSEEEKHTLKIIKKFLDRNNLSFEEVAKIVEEKKKSLGLSSF